MKSDRKHYPEAQRRSPPSRGRGLKCKIGHGRPRYNRVAPLAGAWIEIYARCCLPYYVASPPSRGRGLK